MTLTEYTNLKNKVILQVGSSEDYLQLFDNLKSLFRNDINSPRRYEEIASIADLISVLELRDVLSEDNVSVLKDIVNRLPNDDVLKKRIEDYEMSHVHREHVNYYASENNQYPTREDRSFTLNQSQPHIGTMSKRKKDLIYQAIIEGLGSFWRDLGRNLGIQEGKIDDIDRTHTLTTSKTTELLKCFEHYKADPQGWFLVLCNALDETRRKDLRKELQRIAVMNI